MRLGRSAPARWHGSSAPARWPAAAACSRRRCNPCPLVRACRLLLLLWMLLLLLLGALLLLCRRLGRRGRRQRNRHVVVCVSYDSYDNVATPPVVRLLEGRIRRAGHAPTRVDVNAPPLASPTLDPLPPAVHHRDRAMGRWTALCTLLVGLWSLQCSAQRPRVAIIGGGVAGASAAHYLRSKAPDAAITV